MSDQRFRLWPGGPIISADSEPAVARDGGPFTTKEALAALDFHATKAAKRGDYGCHSDLEAVSKVIEDMENLHALVLARAEQLQRLVADVERRAKAGLESLSRLP